MTVLYRDSDIEDLVSPGLAVEALEAAFRSEAEDRSTVPSRINADVPGGWIRLMPAVVEADGYAAMGFKAMNLREGTGVRYVTLLYDSATGDLVAIMDAARVTRIRTAAVTAIACRHGRPEPVTEIGLFGSGHEAGSHAEGFKAIFPELSRILIYSPNGAHRERFADDIARRLDIDVTATAEPAPAAKAPVVVLATKSQKVVARSEWFGPGTFVLSIGSTRLDLRELDERTFGRAASCIADTPEQVAAESGDVRAALDGGQLHEDQFVRLADLVAGKRTVEWPPDDLLVFKSVGTGLQDLAVSQAVHAACVEAGRGMQLDRFPVLH